MAEDTETVQTQEGLMARKADKPKSKAEVKAAADRAEKRSNAKKKPDLPKTASGKVSAQPLNADGLSSVQRAVNSGYKLISENDLNNLLKSINGLEGDKNETVGMIREKIGYAKEKKNLHTPAFALIRKFDKMEAEKLSDFWSHLRAMMEMRKLDEKIESVNRLPLPEPAQKAEDGEKAEEPEKVAETAADPIPPAPSETNVVQPMFGRLAPQSQSAKAEAIAAAAGTNR